MDIATELANSIIDLTNQILFEMSLQKKENNFSEGLKPEIPVGQTHLSHVNRKRAKFVATQLLSDNIDKGTSMVDAVTVSDFCCFPQQRVNCNISPSQTIPSPIATPSRSAPLLMEWNYSTTSALISMTSISGPSAVRTRLHGTSPAAISTKHHNNAMVLTVGYAYVW